MPTRYGHINEENEIVAYTKITADNTVEEAVDLVWEAITTAHDRVKNENIHLIVKTNNHRNEEGGYVEQFHLFHVNICIRLLSAFVDKLTITNLIQQDCSSYTFEDFLQSDKNAVKTDTDETLLGKSNAIENVTIEEVIEETTLTAEYDEQNESLYWGFTQSN